MNVVFMENLAIILNFSHDLNFAFSHVINYLGFMRTFIMLWPIKPLVKQEDAWLFASSCVFDLR